MTEPDNDNPLHESVRQRLAGHQPPYDPENWQRMRRRLRRERWRPVGWWLVSILVLLGVGWFEFGTKSALPASAKRVMAFSKPTDKRRVPVPDEPSDDVGVLPTPLVRRRAPARPATSVAKPGSVLLPLEPHRLPFLSVIKVLALPPVLVHSPAEPDIVRLVTTGTVGFDSTTYRVFARNLTRWPNAVVVCDFTSSMYLYSTQLLAWFRKNETNRQVRGLVFFTDCDSLGRETEPGQSGRMFVTRSRAVGEVLPLMLASARNTMGNVDDAENNIDPLAYAQRQFPEAEHLILIADNSSAVKDMARLPELHKPVHIILCGPTLDTALAFQPDYYTIARQTGGSLHTLEDDLTQVAQLPPNTWIRIDGRYFRRTKRGRFVRTDFLHRPRRLLGLFWR